MPYKSIVFILAFAFLGSISTFGIIQTIALSKQLEGLALEVAELQAALPGNINQKLNSIVKNVDTLSGSAASAEDESVMEEIE